MTPAYLTADEATAYLAAEAAAEMLAARGVPAVFEPFDASIRIEDDGCLWYFGTVNETWGADLIRPADDRSDDAYIGSCHTDVPSESTDPFAIADAIIAALTRQVGVTVWRD